MYSKSTTRTTLALIPYLNCEPFYAGLDALDLEIVREAPRELGRLAEAGMATCGPMAVADWFRLRDRFDALSDFGITCEGPVHSVLLFARREIRRLAGARVGLTAESSTSAALVRLLLTKRYELDGVRFERGEAAEDDARLLIGDKALIAASTGLEDFPFVYDLGEEWLGWQALPFVYARWVVSKEITPDERRRIERTIEASLATWEDRIAEIAARRGPELGLDQDGIHDYLATFNFRIGPVEALGEQTFESLLRELQP